MGQQESSQSNISKSLIWKKNERSIISKAPTFPKAKPFAYPTGIRTPHLTFLECDFFTLNLWTCRVQFEEDLNQPILQSKPQAGNVVCPLRSYHHDKMLDL
ncbi:hypothetical protein GBA52_015512 [Prunus armeniaca]|nr:hypothetical protein GBA52_015512 [Prunus armeniaca]